MRSLAARLHPWGAHQELGGHGEKQHYESSLGRKESYVLTPMLELEDCWGERKSSSTEAENLCLSPSEMIIGFKFPLHSP